jgi:hypothetical protein
MEVPAPASAAAAAGEHLPITTDELPSFSDFKTDDVAGWVGLLYAFVQRDPKDVNAAKKWLRDYVTERALFRITADVKKDRTIPAVMKAVLAFLSTEAAKTKSRFPTAKQVLANLKGDGSGGGEGEEDDDDDEVRLLSLLFPAHVLFRWRCCLSGNAGPCAPNLTPPPHPFILNRAPRTSPPS